MEKHYHALVVGGGPAGLASAIVLAESGLDVLVCEQNSLPVDKACGEGIMPTGVAQLRQLGVLDYLDTSQLALFYGIRFFSPGGIVASGQFAEGYGLGVRRNNLSHGLLQRANELPAVEIVQNQPIRSFQTLPDCTRIHLGNRSVTAQLVVGADGLHSRVRRWFGLEAACRARRRLGVRQHFRVAPWSQYVDVHIGRGVEAYVTPCGRQQIGLSFLWDWDRFASVPPSEQLLDYFLAFFPDLQERLQRAPAVSRVRGRGPLGCRARGRCADGVILVGDAGGYLDACTGEGISLALAQAALLKDTVVPILQNQRTKPRQKQLKRFAQSTRKISRLYYVCTRLQMTINRFAWLSDRVTSSLAACPEGMSWLLSANMGRIRMRPGISYALRLSLTFLATAISGGRNGAPHSRSETPAPLP